MAGPAGSATRPATAQRSGTPDESAAPMRLPSHLDMARLNALLRGVEAGAPLEPAAIVPFTQSNDRAARGLAKRLLAIVLLKSARENAARLLDEACDDLDFQYPVIFQEALAQAAELKDLDRVFDLRLRAAAQAAGRDDHLGALIQLLNAAAEDFRAGAKNTNDPAGIRRMVEVYERVAQMTQRRLGLAQAARGVRRSPTGGRLRMAHVVAQLVDGGHSTSRAAQTFLRYADRERFDAYLFVTESLARFDQHAGQVIASDFSDRRAPQRIRKFEQELGVPVILPRARTSLLDAAAELHERMAELRIDVAFFHGSLATPIDWLLCAWRSAPWQFDRAFGGPLFCPAVDYQFFEFAGTMEKLAFLCRERGIPYGPLRYGGADLSHVADAEPIPRAAMGVPADHVLLGTMGHHLPARMSERFCRTVARVLRERPRATYVVVGPGPFGAQAAWFGADLCGPTPSAARVRFVGPTDVSERFAQAFDIYVNEYPNGGGVAVGEAMAARKPVVCVKAGETSLAMAGAFYVGPEHLVTPPTDEAYATRLARLIDDPEERARMGQALRARYEAEFDGRKLTQDETERIWRVIHSSQKKPG